MRGLLVEVVLLNVGFAVLFPLTVLSVERVFTTIPGICSPFVWAMLSIAAVAVTVAQLPITYWLARRGIVRWQSASAQPTWASPGLRTVWQHLLVSLLIVAGSLVAAVSQLA